MDAVTLKDVWLKYRIEFRENPRTEIVDFWALKGLSLDITKGETVGIIGENGAGKTTILKLISGMLKPDRGTARISGKVSALIEIGAGFQRDLTGKENIYMTSSLFGLTRDEIAARYDDIVRFAEIGRFMHAPVRCYSQGMFMRLAFAIAIHVEPDILLVDDMFAVGDIYAQRKCMNKMFGLREKGMTIVFVSHDLEISKRLCARGIFIRDGAIVNEGPIDKVCGYYLESVGEKKGISILHEGHLGVIFNNGRLILRWNDRTLTSNPSGQVRITYSGRKYLSATADWEVQESSDREEVTAVGKWPDVPFTLYWKIKILNEKEFVWEVFFRGADMASIVLYNTELFFSGEYGSWFTLENAKDFTPNSAKPKEWDMERVEGPDGRIIGIKGREEKQCLPTILVERQQDGPGIITNVGSTEAEFNAYGINYEIIPNSPGRNQEEEYASFFSMRVKIFRDSEPALGSYLDYSKQVMRESRVINKGPLLLCCQEQKTDIYWQDILLICGVGLDCRFRCRDKVWGTSTGHWFVRKVDDYEIIVTITWKGLPEILMTWILRLVEEDVVAWEASIDVYSQLDIRHKESEIMVNKEYKNWFAGENKGIFLKTAKQFKVGIPDTYVNDRIGVEETKRDDGTILPRILFECDTAGSQVSYITQPEEDSAVTKIKYLGIDRKEDSYASPGKYKFFSGRIKIGGGEEKEGGREALRDGKTAVSSSPDKLVSGRLSLVFDHGKGRIFWKDTELTKGLGLYFSVFSSGVWYDSSQASWKVCEVGKERLSLTGSWPWVFLAQNWEFTLLNEKELLWKISEEKWAEFELEKAQVNIMLSDVYKEWFVKEKGALLKNSGKFPREFIPYNGIYWDRLWGGGEPLYPAAVRKSYLRKSFLNRVCLPEVTLNCSGGQYIPRYAVENTDDLFRSRVLQCELKPGPEEGLSGNREISVRIQIKV